MLLALVPLYPLLMSRVYRTVRVMSCSLLVSLVPCLFPWVLCLYPMFLSLVPLYPLLMSRVYHTVRVMSCSLLVSLVPCLFPGYFACIPCSLHWSPVSFAYVLFTLLVNHALLINRNDGKVPRLAQGNFPVFSFSPENSLDSARNFTCVFMH